MHRRTTHRALKDSGHFLRSELAFGSDGTAEHDLGQHMLAEGDFGCRPGSANVYAGQRLFEPKANCFISGLDRK